MPRRAGSRVVPSRYSAEPDFGWYRLRREWPSIYESHADLAFETWTKVKIPVAARAATNYLSGPAGAGSDSARCAQRSECRNRGGRRHTLRPHLLSRTTQLVV